MYRFAIVPIALSIAWIIGSAGIAEARELPPEKARSTEPRAVERGRYLVKIGGCNDCHTPRYAETAGGIPESQWLTGDRLGWNGPWGTTYARNLRIFMAKVSEDDWVRVARTTRFRPPMPWFNLRDMSEGDLRAVYRFVRYLGPAGEPAPEYVPPGVAPAGPVIAFPQ